MMKLRPKVLEPGKGNLGGLGTWIPVVVVVAAVALHLFDVIPALWAALPVAVALLYTMAEPVAYRILREGQFPAWARAAAVVLVLGTIAWAAIAVVYWSMPGNVIAEGDLMTTEDTLAVHPEDPGERRDFLLEVSVSKLPAGDKAVSFPYTLRVGTNEVRGHFGREKVRRRFGRSGSASGLRDRMVEFHRLRMALDPKKDKIRLGSILRNPGGQNLKPEEAKKKELDAPIHVLLQETPFTRLTMGLISVPLLLLAAVVEAFEDRSRREQSRLAMLVGGILAAVIYFLIAVTEDNVLMGVLGSAIAGLAGAIGAFVVAFLAAKVIPQRQGR
jgi:hypothetical protein